MMDWLKQALGSGMKSEGGSVGRKIGGAYENMTDEEIGQHISDAFDKGMAVSMEVKKLIADRSKEYADKDLMIDATIVIFAAVWLTMEWAKGGVVKMRKSHGSDSPVVKLWEIMSIAYGQDDPKDGIAAIFKWAKDHDLDL